MFSIPRSVSRVALCASLVSLSLLAACNKTGSSEGSTAQVAVKVNGQEVSVHQYNIVLARLNGGAPAENTPEVVLKAALNNLVNREIAVQAAMKKNLDQDPQVIQQLEAARRDVLAKAYLDISGQNVTMPSSNEVDQFFVAHPELFSNRHLFVLQEAVVPATKEQVLGIKAKIESASDVAQISNILRDANLNFTTKLSGVAAEDVPSALLPELSKLKEGQSLVLPSAQGMRVVSVVRSQLSPIDDKQANNMIRAFLQNQKKAELVQSDMKSLISTAKVDYQGKFADLSKDSSTPQPAASEAKAP